jgi:cytochrome c-type biogenesis protein CcmH
MSSFLIRVRKRRPRTLMEELRCLVCQGASLADSDAVLAGDMRAMVRQRIAAGEEPEQVRAWLIQRYGNWVSYRPPVEPVTWPLWATPILLLLAGAWLLRRRLVRRRG